MARLLSNRIAWQYTTDAGEVYRVAAVKDITSQNKLGGASSDGTDPPLPPGFKMRRISLSNATIGLTRTVPIYSPDAAILTPQATVNLNAGHMVDLTWTEDSYAFTNDQSTPVSVIAEKHPRKSPVTRQST